MEDGLFVRMVFPREEFTLNNVKSWIEELVLFTPSKMRTKTTERKFNKNQLYRELDKLFTNGDLNQLDLRDDRNFFTLSNFYSQLPSIICTLSKSVCDTITVEQISEKFNNFFQEHNGIVGHAVSSEDQKWQNNCNIEMYKKSGKPLSELMFKPDFFNKDKQMIDIECFPGHNHFSKIGLWLGSSWKMWFGKQYYSLIPKIKLLSLSEEFVKMELKYDAISIILYEDVWEYDNPKNRDIQWKFRREVGIDEIAHEIGITT